MRSSPGALDLRVRRDRLGSLGPVARHHPLDVGAPVDGDEDLLDVATGPVLLGLRDLLHLHAQQGEGPLQRLLEVLRPGDVALPRVRHRRQWAPDVLGPRGVHAGRHLAQAVVVVPAVQVAYGDVAPADLLDDQVDGQELTQVAEVDRAGRAGPRGAGDQLGTLTRVPDRVVRSPGDPVVGFGAGAGGLLATCHEFAAPARCGCPRVRAGIRAHATGARRGCGKRLGQGKGAGVVPAAFRRPVRASVSATSSPDVGRDPVRPRDRWRAA